MLQYIDFFMLLGKSVSRLWNKFLEVVLVDQGCIHLKF